MPKSQPKSQSKSSQKSPRKFAKKAQKRAKIALFIGILTAAILPLPVSATNNTNTGVSVEVVNGCSISATGSDHSAEITPGTYVESIGDPTVFQIACNDTNVYTVYAIGYSNDTEGNTNLIGTSGNGNIETGVQQSGSTSNWSFHLLENSAGVTISPTFDQPHEIPGSSTVIAKRESGFKNLGTSSFDLFKVKYSIYTSPIQPAGSYSGKVKYTLFNQGISYGYKITYDLNGGDSGPDPQIAESMDTTIKLSSTTPVRDGYDFVAWCSKDPDEAEECPGDSYEVSSNYTLPGNNADVTLYATWKKHKPVYGEVCNADKTGKVMKDGKCWSSSDVSSMSNWSNALTLCNDKGNGWRLPSQSDFNDLIRAYYPSASTSGTGYYYSGSTSDLAADWGATYNYWWSSTIGGIGAYLLDFRSSYVNSNYPSYNSTRYVSPVRCVSSV